jgi:atypical dual specificity phosphatase
MSLVLPRLWLGGTEDAFDNGGRFLRAARITHILNCAEELTGRAYPAELEECCRIPLVDEEAPAAEAQIRTAAGKLEEWMRGAGVILVHCAAGISRSPTVVMAWLILYRAHTFDDAWTRVARARNFIRPNAYFVSLLRALKN